MKDKNIVAIPIGDWSDDGHGKVVWYHIVVPKKFTKEILTEQYNKNKQLLGFGLKDFAADYEDGTMSIEQFDALRDFGFSSDIQIDEDDEEKIYLDIETFFEITMFLLSEGLEDFEWYEIKPDFDLFTGRDMDGHIGYGLFW